MTDAPARPRGVRALLGAVGSSELALWVSFVLVHAWLGGLALLGPGGSLGDVDIYRYWVESGIASHQWVGIDIPWVYPIVALVPMLIAHVFGSVPYVSTWLSLVMLLDAGAFAAILAIGRDRRRMPAAWWWLGFLLLLGPIALGRVDAIAIPLAIAGVQLLLTAPRAATVLLTLAAWIKVWPAALVVAAIVVLRRRLAVLVTAVVGCVVIIGTAVILGGAANVFSFITQLTGRGIEIEAPMATLWMWDAGRHTGSSSVFYDTGILAFEVVGPGIAVVGSIVTVLLALAVAGLLVGAGLLVRQAAPLSRLLPLLTLALTMAFLVFNKVGSPQYGTWLAVPICLGLVARFAHDGVSFRTPALLALLAGGLTQLIYPFFFDPLVATELPMLVVLTVRNGIYVALFVWAVRGLIDLWRDVRWRALGEQRSFAAD